MNTGGKWGVGQEPGAQPRDPRCMPTIWYCVSAVAVRLALCVYCPAGPQVAARWGPFPSFHVPILRGRGTAFLQLPERHRWGRGLIPMAGSRGSIVGDDWLWPVGRSAPACWLRTIELQDSAAAGQGVREVAVLPGGWIPPTKPQLLRQWRSAVVQQGLGSPGVRMTAGVHRFRWGRGSGGDRGGLREGHIDVDGFLLGHRSWNWVVVRPTVFQDGLEGGRGGSRWEVGLAPGPFKHPVGGIKGGQVLWGWAGRPGPGHAWVSRGLPHNLIIEILMFQLRRWWRPIDPCPRRDREAAVLIREVGVESWKSVLQGHVAGDQGKVGRGWRLWRGRRLTGQRVGVLGLARCRIRDRLVVKTVGSW